MMDDMETNNGDREDMSPVMMASPPTTLCQEVWSSSELLFQNRITWLLVLGPVALLGDATGTLGEATCFALSGIALIPCAERLSFVTEQVAAHTNGTIGALLNATFGNAPELLIATAALRSGFYRVVQLAMLGSMLTNLLLVFGVACVVGGTRWQVQELRITSGNVSVGLLFVSVAASLLPAALNMSGQLRTSTTTSEATSTTSSEATTTTTNHLPSTEELQFSRINAVVMIVLYGCYLMFQLGTHKEEFDDDDDENTINVVQAASGHELHLTPHFTSRHGRQTQARRNLFCKHLLARCYTTTTCSSSSRRRRQRPDESTNGGNHHTTTRTSSNGGGDVELSLRRYAFRSEKRKESDRGLPHYSDTLENNNDDNDDDDDADQSQSSMSSSSSSSSSSSGEVLDLLAHDNLSACSDNLLSSANDDDDDDGSAGVQHRARSRRVLRLEKIMDQKKKQQQQGVTKPRRSDKSHDSDFLYPDAPPVLSTTNNQTAAEPEHGAQMTFRAGIAWLLIITLCISAMSDILVDTIDGFAYRANLSEVFTSMVIVPFFSNVAEQVSAVLFAYRNEMDLCVGVTVGSAIQVATFVLPGCVLIGMMVDRSMTLFFHGYETACLFLAVVVVAAVLQGGTTNWLVGVTLIGIYIMIAAGFWFHELEDLSTDAEISITNSTSLR